MIRVRLLLCVVLCALLGGGWLAGQEEKGKVRGTLPANWRKLGLSSDQVQKVYTVQGEFRGKISVLQAQIDKLKAQEKTELAKVLTPAQKERLQEILTGKVPGEPAKEKKPDSKKPGDK